MKRWIVIGVLLAGLVLVAQLAMPVSREADAQSFPTPAPMHLDFPTPPPMHLDFPTPPPMHLDFPTPPPMHLDFPTPPPMRLPVFTPAPVYRQVERPRDGVICWYVEPQYVDDNSSAMIRYSCEDETFLVSLGSVNTEVLMVDVRGDDGSTSVIGLTTVIPVQQ
jgi:hypothetical protein